jgi:FkbM family methyltransferase
MQDLLGEEYEKFVTKAGFDFIVPKGRIAYQERMLRDHGVYEPATERAISRFVKPGMRVVECGACCGYHALNLAKAVGPTGKVYCFEANPELMGILNRNLAVNGVAGFVEVINKGVWSKAGTLPFPIFRRGLGVAGFGYTQKVHDRRLLQLFRAVTRLRIFRRFRKLKEIVEVEVITLDDWVTGFGYTQKVQDRRLLQLFGAVTRLRIFRRFRKLKDIVEVEVITLDDFLREKQIDFLRMDIEGGELPVIEGAKNALREMDVGIILEWTPENVTPVESDKLFGLLTSLGYRLYRILDAGYVPIWSADELHSAHREECVQGQRDLICRKTPIDAS